MTPLGTYSRMSMDRSVLGVSHVRTAFTIHTFLRTCKLTFLRREIIEGRSSSVFRFSPQPNVMFDEGEEYIERLTGEIVIDAEDHIVTRLSGWPSNVSQASVPAVYQTMTRVKDGTWLASVKRINGADYPNLFDNLKHEWSCTYSNYVRFVSEIKDVKVNQPPNQQQD